MNSGNTYVAGGERPTRASETWLLGAELSRDREKAYRSIASCRDWTNIRAHRSRPWAWMFKAGDYIPTTARLFVFIFTGADRAATNGDPAVNSKPSTPGARCDRCPDAKEGPLTI